MLTRHRLYSTGLALAIAVTWLLVVLRVQPWPFSDYGVFLAVAQRLNAGDVLYQGVWDNKDPFVYYSIALLQNVGQSALWILEVGWFALASAAVYVISRNSELSSRWSLLIAGVLAPVALIPFHYFPGTTHVPGVALSLSVIAAHWEHRYALSGIALGFLLFFKLSMLPLALVPLAILMIRHRAMRSLIPVGLAAAITTAVGIAILALRGELSPYLGSLQHNFTYLQTNTDSGSTDIAAVLAERLTVLSGAHVLITVIVIAGTLLATAVRSKRTDTWQLATGSYLTALLLIAAIGKFPHHAQVLGVSAALTLVTLLISIPQLRRTQPVLAAALAALLALAMTGIPSIKGHRDALRNPQGTWIAMTTVDAATQDLLDSGPPRTFAVVQGAQMPRSAELNEWDLVCRHLAQRPWESQQLLQESLDCFPTAEVLLLPRDFAIPAGPAPYRDFIAGVQSLIDRNYTCTTTENHQICTRLNESDPA